MTRAEIIKAHTATLINDYAKFVTAGGMGHVDFWENICSQYTSSVIKGLLAHIGVSLPAATIGRQWAQFDDAHRG